MRKLGVALALAMLAGPVRAEWHEAQSENFVIYADDRAEDIQRFGEMLERYHAAMELLTGREVSPPSPSSRVTIYVVGSEREFEKLGLGENVAGFYIPRAGGSVAFVPNIKVRSGETDFSLIVLMHEYAHHFLISGSRHAMPRWLSEGAAEFFASAKFPSDGSVEIGRPAYHRAAELTYAADVSVEELLDHKLYEEQRGKTLDAFYGRAWALYHYLSFDEERRGQLPAYWKSVTAGTSSREAALSVFGDLEELEDDLDSYLRRRRILSYDLPADWLTIGSVGVRQVSEGMAEVLPLVIRSKRGVDDKTAAELLSEVQAVAARFPNDARVLAALAEAEYDAGNDAAAIAAADRAIAADPTVKNAYVQKGYALFRIAPDAADRDVAYTAAMVPFTALNKLENDHPLPLIYFYRSYAERGEAPSDHARHALERASMLAPFDKGLAMQVAMMQAREGRIDWARETLQPIAADPHGGDLAGTAQVYLQQLESAVPGEPWYPDAMPTATAAINESDVE